MFQVGGADIYVHKYLGPKNPSDENATAAQPQYDFLSETNIQDLLFLENRDRTYDPSIYRMRAVYNVQDLDFNLSQFGLFIDNDTLYMTTHINDFIRTVGRKPLTGDVIEIPNLKDEFALNNADVSLPRYYVISDVGRAAEGFSPTWYPHLYRLKLTKITNSQQYSDILNTPTDQDANFKGDYAPGTTYYPGDILRYKGLLYEVIAETTGNIPPNFEFFKEYGGDTIQDLLSTQNKVLEINDMLINQAELDAPRSGYETSHLYTLAVDQNGNAALETVDSADIDASVDSDSVTASAMFAKPARPGYSGYLLGDGVPENGAAFGHGITFPENPLIGDYYLRTDFLPNRLFSFDGARWVKREDAIRTSMTPSAIRNNQKGTFINNTNRTGVDKLVSDVITITSNTILVDIEYTREMYAEVALYNSTYEPMPVTESDDGKAVITLTSEYPIGARLEWQLFRSSVEERQALSTALKKKPQADI